MNRCAVAAGPKKMRYPPFLLQFVRSVKFLAIGFCPMVQVATISPLGNVLDSRLSTIRDFILTVVRTTVGMCIVLGQRKSR